MDLSGILRYQNPDSSQDLNRKMFGVISKGVLDGTAQDNPYPTQLVFPVAGQLKVSVVPFAAMGADGMMTIASGTPEILDVTAGITQYVVLRAKYNASSAPLINLEVLTSAQYASDPDRTVSYLGQTVDFLIVLAKITLGALATEVLNSDIDLRENHVINSVGYHQFKGSYANFASLPANPGGGPTSLVTGVFALALAERQFYQWNGTIWETITDGAISGALQDHIDGTDDPAHPADRISYVPSGEYDPLSTRVQSALTDVGNRKANRAGDTFTGKITVNANGANDAAIIATGFGTVNNAAIVALADPSASYTLAEAGAGILAVGGASANEVGGVFRGGGGGGAASVHYGTGADGSGIVTHGGGNTTLDTPILGAAIHAQASATATSSVAIYAEGKTGANSRAITALGKGTSPAIFAQSVGGAGTVGSSAIRVIGGTALSGNVAGGTALSVTGGDGVGTNQNGGVGISAVGGAPTGSGVGGTGVYGEAGSGGGTGVLGDGGGSNGTGVLGRTSSTNGIAVKGEATSSTGVAVRAEVSGSGVNALSVTGAHIWTTGGLAVFQSNAGDNVTLNTSMQSMEFSLVSVAEGNLTSSHTSATDTTLPAGRYRVTYKIIFLNPSTGVNIGSRATLDGTLIPGSLDLKFIDGSEYTSLSSSFVVTSSGSQVLTIQASQETGSTVGSLATVTLGGETFRSSLTIERIPTLA